MSEPRLAALIIESLRGDGLLDAGDDADGDGALHVTDSETAERWVLAERLNVHWLGWLEDDEASIARFDVFIFAYQLKYK